MPQTHVPIRGTLCPQLFRQRGRNHDTSIRKFFHRSTNVLFTTFDAFFKRFYSTFLSCWTSFTTQTTSCTRTTCWSSPTHTIASQPSSVRKRCVLRTTFWITKSVVLSRFTTTLYSFQGRRAFVSNRGIHYLCEIVIRQTFRHEDALKLLLSLLTSGCTVSWSYHTGSADFNALMSKLCDDFVSTHDDSK